MASIRDIIQQKPWLGWVLFLATVVVVVFGGLFALSIMERRNEERAMFQLVKPIAQWGPRNKVWGENFPREYESYKKTSSTSFSSKHGGSVMIDFLKKYPNLVILWAGYGFSRDYNQSRGHYNAMGIVAFQPPNESVPTSGNAALRGFCCHHCISNSRWQGSRPFTRTQMAGGSSQAE